MRHTIRRLFGRLRLSRTSGVAPHPSPAASENRASSHVSALRIAAGRIERRLAALEAADDPERWEFSAFSQAGEDGWIQYLLHHSSVGPRTFVEFGVEDYQESNTRFLVEADMWRGLVIDASAEHIARIQSQDICWRRSIVAVSKFLTVDNVDDTIRHAGLSGDIGLLSIDVDGNDYWIWDAIQSVEPRIVVCEYNALFGPTATVTIPYAREFCRFDAHYSGLFFGASLAALESLATQKGYALIGCNRFGSNAFFVRESALGRLRRSTSQRAFRPPVFRQSRDQQGRLTFLDIPRSVELIGEMEVHDVVKKRNVAVAELGLWP